MSIGTRIKECRENLGITQEELAKLLNVSKGAIGNYEADISYPKIENMTKLFSILKTDANYLFQDDAQLSKETFSMNEIMHIKKYRTLDEHGKRAIDNLLDNEYDRCVTVYKEHDVQSSSSQNNVYTAQIAAFGGGNSETQVSEENLKQAIKAVKRLDKKKSKKD